MATLDHPGSGHDHVETVPPEYALLLLLAVVAVGLVLAWPWVW